MVKAFVFVGGFCLAGGGENKAPLLMKKRSNTQVDGHVDRPMPVTQIRRSQKSCRAHASRGLCLQPTLCRGRLYLSLVPQSMLRCPQSPSCVAFTSTPTQVGTGDIYPDTDTASQRYPCVHRDAAEAHLRVGVWREAGSHGEVSFISLGVSGALGFPRVRVFQPAVILPNAKAFDVNHH